MSPERTMESESHAIKCELAAEVLRSSGKLRLQVGGWSMLPTVFPGDTLLVERYESREVAKGDIVLFSRDRRLFAHRALRSGSRSGVLTQGDAMPAPDPPVQGEEVLGKVIRISRNGKHIQPRKWMRFRDRAVAACVQRSEVAARLIVSVHGLRQTSPV
ncbi:MAG TPA: S24/S26 family peptidase [Candidatus Sulfotelmatobacter sp.]